VWVQPSVVAHFGVAIKTLDNSANTSIDLDRSEESTPRWHSLSDVDRSSTRLNLYLSSLVHVTLHAVSCKSPELSFEAR
jgi:hypothetical protein